ncbi:sensor histidine kinase [Kribbella albertanoniae]|uniref:histidine kinase n=2 Tax=Kribbella albertanoniae TaxID=1266829 RepID=A0A4V2XMN3_9ACTN|nr:sensor histidine kinase [Kribbella albertanoniae]
MDLGGHRGPDVIAYLFAVGLGALMLVRRPFPVLALVATAVGLLAYYAIGYPAVGLALPVAAALYSAAEAGKFRIAAATAVGLIVVSTAFRLGQGESVGYLIGFELASTAGLMLSAIALGATVRATRLLRAEHRRTEQRAVSEREREARRRVEAERLRIAHDLHDAIGHTIAVVSVQTSVALEALDDDPEATRAALSTIRTASSAAVRELRTMVGLLTDAESRAPVGSLEHVELLIEATIASGLAVGLRVEGEPEVLPTVVDTTAYRIVQEALTNSLKHAGASRADVVLRYQPACLEITVSDDGVGAVLDESRGRGLAGMRERVGLIGGEVDFSSGPGFRIHAVLPFLRSPGEGPR